MKDIAIYEPGELKYSGFVELPGSQSFDTMLMSREY